MRDVKVQWLSLQASVDMPVNRACHRCEPGARGIRREHLWGDGPFHLAWPMFILSQALPSLGSWSLVPQPVGHRLEGTVRRRGCALLTHAFCVLYSLERDFHEPRELQRLYVSCKPTELSSCPSYETFNGAKLQNKKALSCLVRLWCNCRASQQTFSLVEMLLQNSKHYL